MATAAKTQGTITVDGHEVTITNPDKILFPLPGITKLEFLQSLIKLSPYLIKYCRNRYLTTIRFPHGVGDDKSFYQKNCPEPAPPFVKTALFQNINYVNLDNLATLLWLGNLACLEFHPSFNAIGGTQPCEWMIDIDPTLEEEPRIMEAAAVVGGVLRSLGIRSVPKTSGATGVQIVVPIQPKYSFEQLRKLGQFIAEYVVQTRPDLFTIERLKKDRGTLIYFDYLQHWHGKTLSSPYTPRARPHATVSAPLTWEEVERNVSALDFNLRTMEQRLREKGDLIEQVPPQSLDRVLEALGRR